MKGLEIGFRFLKPNFWNYKKRAYAAEIFNGVQLIFVSATMGVIYGL
jgi:hypothetical protein